MAAPQLFKRCCKMHLCLCHLFQDKLFVGGKSSPQSDFVLCVCVTRVCVYMDCVNCCCSFSSCHLVGDLTPKPTESIKSLWNIFLVLDWFKALCSHQGPATQGPAQQQGVSARGFLFVCFLLFLFTANHMT